MKISYISTMQTSLQLLYKISILRTPKSFEKWKIYLWQQISENLFYLKCNTTFFQFESSITLSRYDAFQGGNIRQGLPKRYISFSVDWSNRTFYFFILERKVCPKTLIHHEWCQKCYVKFCCGENVLLLDIGNLNFLLLFLALIFQL